jgi:hypothetical protein
MKVTVCKLDSVQAQSINSTFSCVFILRYYQWFSYLEHVFTPTLYHFTVTDQEVSLLESVCEFTLTQQQMPINLVELVLLS